MAKTIQLGIDLGTTNSAIVVDHDGKIEVIKNTDQLDYTPSVFGYNKGKNIQVGKKAYDQLFQYADLKNVENYKAEVKRLMGTRETVHFEVTDEDLSAEKISSEILKYLKECALKKYPDLNTDGVVITVPAYFTTTQKEATAEAGKLAGFKHVVLMQEPIAGAMAYGFDSEVNGNRLVYDLGGGTFDVAIISSKDGTLTVKGHAGDNYLGGKDFDNLVVEKIILPYLENKYELHQTLNNEKKKKALMNRLKYAAEVAKKDLTDYETTSIQIDNIRDDDDEDIEATIDFSRKEFEDLISKKVSDSIKLCKEALEESGLSKENIDKVVLVGGSTMTPYIRETIEKELGISVDSSVDPLTVVAKGACIFGRSQVIPADIGDEKREKRIADATIKLNYEPTTSNTEEMVTGVVGGIDLDEIYYIQIQSEDGSYSSSKLKLKNGKFFDEVVVREKQVNQYFIYLTDEQGNIISLDNDSFTITHGGVEMVGVPISYSVSVALRKSSLLGSKDGEDYCDVIFEKGLTLPLETTKTFHTAKELKKGDTENVLPIRIYEGESKKPDRNYLVCELNLRGTDIPFSLPKGTDVDITLKMDESGKVSASAYFSDIDYYVEAVGRTRGDEPLSTTEMKKEIDSEHRRFNEMKSHLSTVDKAEVNDMFEDLDSNYDSSDEDTKRKTDAGIKKLKMKLDKLEDKTEGSQTLDQFREKVKNVSDAMRDLGGEDLIGDEFNTLKKEGEEAIRAEDWEKLGNVSEQLQRLIFVLLFNTPEGLKMLLSSAYQHRHEAVDVVRANQLFDRAVQYINSDNVAGMQECLRAIWDLLPKGASGDIGNINLSGITK